MFMLFEGCHLPIARTDYRPIQRGLRHICSKIHFSSPSSLLNQGSRSSSSLHIDGPRGGACTAGAISGIDCFEEHEAESGS